MFDELLDLKHKISDVLLLLLVPVIYILIPFAIDLQRSTNLEHHFHENDF